MGSDSLWHGCQYGIPDFNPRSPCGERRLLFLPAGFLRIFQSTLPVWGATGDICKSLIRRHNFNPRSPCGERLINSSTGNCVKNFNPRSPCGERPLRFPACLLALIFQSTLPVWGATSTGHRDNLTTIDFNPRSPCGERHIFVIHG